MKAADSPHDSARQRRSGRLIATIAGLCLGLLLAALDQTVFATALPTIAGELGGADRIAWVNTGYVLAATAMMPVYGRLSDVTGRKPALLAALLLFVVGSVVGGLSTGMTGLIAGRFIQGLGGGGLLILVQAIVADLVPARERAPYLALIGAVFGVSSMGGPLLGGWLTDGVGWRWAFWINVPLGLLAAAVACLCYRERRAGSAKTPLIPIHVLRERDVLVATSSGLLLAVAMFGVVGYLPTYLQMATDLSPTAAGLMMLPLALGIAVTTLTAAQVIARTGRYTLIPVAGAALAGLALGALALRPADGALAFLGVALFALGLGIGCTWDTLLLVVQNGRATDDIGTATATYSFFREIGVTLGTAAVGSIFAARLTDLLAQRLPGPALQAQALTPAFLDHEPEQVRAVIALAYHDALTPVFAMLIPLTLGAAAILRLLSGRALETTRPQQAGTNSVAARARLP